jgi:pSer/pThr/pTyr-binding forkhead associated (FHA) protein
MSVVPNIIVQLIHIEGPLKGEIQEFNSLEILIGRHPDCQVQFPKDVVIISRKHARIVREGNRFKLIDQSTNGTFVNGQQAPEAYLKEGDVITFSEGGPKVSFLTQTSDQSVLHPRMPSVAKPTEPATATLAPQDTVPPSSSPALQPARQQPAAQPIPEEASTPQVQPCPAVAPSADAQRIQIPFAVQYGPALKSFQSLPITLGKGGHCDFVVNHPTLYDQQAQIFFSQDQYWVKDLTGTNAVLINDMPVSVTAALQSNMLLSLSPQGPKFRFLDSGRLVEVEELLPEESPSPAPQAKPIPSKVPGKFDVITKKAESLFKKILKFIFLLFIGCRSSVVGNIVYS